ncbi:hypothetical protein [Streptomyces sirii]|uniref:hypothetical protein n=1 Tax=Streptomyces sirii TaxID=3127701 RepID=UPI003D36881B
MADNAGSIRRLTAATPIAAHPRACTPILTELGLQPEAYDPHLDVDFSSFRGDSPPAPDGYSQAS